MIEGPFHSLYRPAQIILLRHAEKPLAGPELSLEGFNRSRLLPVYFYSQPSLTEFGDPVAIVAASPNKKEGSIRSIQTVIHLASSLQIKINENFQKDQEHALAMALLNTPTWHNKTVVICWNRQGLPKLTQLLGANAPFYWKKDCFDKFWVIRYQENLSPIFTELDQKLV